MTNRRVLVFGALTGVFAAGYGVMFTVLDEFRDEYGIAEEALGAIIAVGFFSSFLSQVLIAPLADRGYARRLVLIGMAFEVVGLFGMAFGTNVAVLLSARLIMGIGAGLAIPSIRRIVILSDPDQLGGNVGKLLAADVTGFAMGPAISAVLVPLFGISAPFLVIVAATFLGVPVILRIRVDESDRGVSTQARFAFDLLRDRRYVGALCHGAAVFMMIGTFDALWVLVLDDLGTADWVANVGIIAFAVPMVFLASFGGRLAQRIGPFRVGAVGLALSAVFMFLYGQAASGGVMLGISLVHAFNDGVMIPSSGVAVGMVVPGARQAGAQGLLGGVQTLLGGMAALLAGALYGGVGRGAAFTAAAVVVAALAVTGYRLGRSPAGVPAVPSPTTVP